MVKEATKAAAKKSAAKKKTAAKKKVSASKQAGNGGGDDAPVAKPTARSRKVAGTQKTPALARQLESQKHEQLRQWIAEAAYYRAKERDFIPGSEVDDWLWAEQQIKERL